MSITSGAFTVGRLRLVLWALGGAAEIAAFYFLFRGSDEVPTAAVVHRAVGGSFIACGLIVWHRRPHSRTGILMTLTGFLFFAEPLLAELDSSAGFTLAQLLANWWTIPFAALVLGFPAGRLATRIDAAIIAAFVFVQVVLQLVWLLFLEFPPGTTNVLLISAEPGLADDIDTFQRWFAVLVPGLALVVTGASRWLQAPPPLRRLLLPTLAGSLALLILMVQIAYELVVSEPGLGSTRVTQLASAVAFLTVPLAFLFGLLRAQFARSAVGDLFVELRHDPGPAELREALARALGDPSLELAYWLPDYGAYADLDGRRVDVEAEGERRAITLIDGKDESHVAAVLHDRALRDEPELLDAVAAAAGIWIENARLHADLRARLEELRGSRARIFEEGQKERRRLERNLHDGAQQRLVALSLQLSLLEGQLRGDPEARARLDEARREVASSLDELRALARGLHPAVVSDHGLDVALEQVVARAPVPVVLRIETDGRLPEPVEVAAFYLVSECLANVGKYAQATSVTVAVTRRGTEVVVEVVDNGCGGADEERGSGIRGLADRVEALGGRLRVWSPTGGGTRVQAEIPCAS